MQSGKITVDNILAVLWKPRKQHCILLYTTYLYRKCVKIFHNTHCTLLIIFSQCSKRQTPENLQII